MEVRLKSQFDDSECLIEAVTIPVICQDIAAQISEDSFVEFLRLQNRNLADDTVVPEVQVTPGISLLIGSDQVWKILTGEVVRCKESEGLVAVNTKIGWTLQGPSIPKGILTSASTLMVCVLNTQTLAEDEMTSQLLKAFWELDAMGISAKEATDDKLNLCTYFEENIVKDGQRYEVAFPWKEDCTEPLENNRDIAVSRLRSLLRRLSSKEGLLHRYDTTIRQYIKLGHAEVVPSDLEGDNKKRIYYMPHREVVREESTTTKLRVVFDASSRAKGCKSLNDCLEKGPNLNPDILQILLRFRWYAIALTADIEKAFLQIKISQKDRDAVRFLWFANEPTGPFDLESLQEWRMTRVPFGVSSTPFLLSGTIQHHLKMWLLQRTLLKR